VAAHAHSLDVKVSGGRRDWRRDRSRTGTGAAAVAAALALLFAGGDEQQLALVMAPGQIVFGVQAAGSTSAEQPVTLTNQGTAAVGVSSLVLSNPASFRVARTDCPAGVVGPGLSCSVFVQFQPLTEGGFAGALLQGGDGPRVELQGTGGPPQIAGGSSEPRQPPPPPDKSDGPPRPGPEAPPGPEPAPPRPPVANASFEFASYETKALVGDTVLVDAVLRNTGETTIGTVQLRVGGDSSAFALQSGSCDLGGPGSTCTVRVRFTPAQEGTLSETLVAATDRELARTRLTGVATPKSPTAVLSRTRIEFTKTGEQATVVVQNAGSAPLRIGDVAVDNTKDFDIVADACRARVIDPQNACAMFVRFKGRTRTSGRVTVRHNDPRMSSSVELAALTAPQLLTVPRLTGSKRDEALRDIVRARFTVGSVTEVARCDSLGDVFEQRPARGAQAIEGSPIDIWIATIGPNPAIVPDVHRQSQADAERRLLAERLQPRTIGKEETDSVPDGRIARMDPRPGTRLAPNCPVTLRVAVPVPKIPVPDYRKRSLADVKETLKGGAAGFFAPFRLGNVSTSDGRRVPAGEDKFWIVVGQSPAAGTPVPRPSGLAVGTPVDLTVARPDVSRIN
jgi:beta-lactam-binding protein with PASTA domain